jgi:integrase
MATGNITKTAVDTLSGWLWDGGHARAVNGFGARRQTDGVFYYLRYRLAGRQRMKSIGRHGSPWTPETARKEALRLLGLVVAGTDLNREAALAAATFDTETARYLTRRAAVLRPRSLVQVTRHLRSYLKPLHAKPLAAIGRRDIAELLAQIETNSGAVTRNRVRSSAFAFFNWALAEGLLPDDAINPVQGTATADTNGSRDRVLTDAELRDVWRALSGDRFSDIVRLLILTGQRAGEIGGLRWAEIELDAIRLPPARTKNGQEHLLPLSPQAAAILAARREAAPAGDFVFAPAAPFNCWSDSKRRLDDEIAGFVAPWRIHDLRRTAATGMANLGVAPHIVEAVLNHVSGHKAGVAGIYNRARYLIETRAALCRWADHVAAIVTDPPPTL